MLPFAKTVCISLRLSAPSNCGICFPSNLVCGDKRLECPIEV